MEHEIEIAQLLKDLGMPASLSGYEYLKLAIEIGMTAQLYGNVTKKLYPSIAETFDTKPERVERCIRNAIERLWERGNTELINRMFSYSIDPMKGKPTNMEFIAVLAEHMRMKKRDAKYTA